MKQLNSTRWGLILAMAVLISFCHSCITTEKAIQKVLTTKSAFDTVGQVYTQLHPCNPITIRIKSDTTFQHDTTTVSKVDTVGKYIHDTVNQRVTLKWYIRDTTTIVDGQQIEILKSQLADKNNQISALNQSVTDCNLLIGKEHSRGNQWQLWFWLLVGAIVGIVVIDILWKSYTSKL